MLTRSVIAVLCAAAVVPAYGQKPPEEEQAFHSVLNAQARATVQDPHQDEDLYDLVQALITIKLQSILKLSDEETLKHVHRVGAFKDDLTRVRFERSDARETLRACIHADLNESILRQKLDQLLSLEEESVRLTRLLIEESARDLDTVQQAKLYLFIGDFEQDMRRLMQQARARAHGADAAAANQGSVIDSPEANAAFRDLLRNENRDVDLSESDEMDMVAFVDTLLMARLAQALRLSPEDTVVLVRRVGKFKDQLHRLRWQIGGEREELRSMIESNAAPKDISQKLEDLLMQEEASADRLRSFVEGVYEDFSMAQAANLYLFLGDFEEYLVNLIEMSREAAPRVRR